MAAPGVARHGGWLYNGRRRMTLEFPQHHVTSLHDLGARLVESRKVGTDLQTLARDLLAGFFELCLRSGLDGLLVELQLDVADPASLADHPTLFPALVAQLETIDLDGGGPRGARPRQLADAVLATLGLTVADEADRTITLGNDVRAQVLAALAGVVDPELAVPQVRETIVAMARERCDPQYLGSFARIVAQLDERGLQMTKQPKVPLDAVQSVQRILFETRNALIDRIARTAIDRAQEVIARTDAVAAARIDQPVTLRLTPRDVAILRACDARVPKMAGPIVQVLLESLADVARLAWRVPEQAVRLYAASQTFTVGELIEHPKFGRGSVTGALAQRIDVEFADGKHTLVHVPARK
jgi:hypothetical protein